MGQYNYNTHIPNIDKRADLVMFFFRFSQILLKLVKLVKLVNLIYKDLRKKILVKK